MERALDAPAGLRQPRGRRGHVCCGRDGILCSPMGMVSLEKCVPEVLLPRPHAARVRVRRATTPRVCRWTRWTPACCGKMHFTMSDKDYTQVAGEEAGFLQKKLIQQARDQGMANDKVPTSRRRFCWASPSRRERGLPRRAGSMLASRCPTARTTST